MPHFEKMCYDNSELLRNYLHGWQVTRNPLLRETAEGIIGWVNECLSDRARGGFYASQDADYSLDDDGDYFTWTLEELRGALSSGKRADHGAYYDVERMARCTTTRRKTFCGSRETPARSPRRWGLERRNVRLDDLAQAKGKMSAARRRPGDSICGQNAVRLLECDVCFGVSRCGAQSLGTRRVKVAVHSRSRRSTGFLRRPGAMRRDLRIALGAGA